MEKSINFRISQELKDDLEFISEEKEIKVSQLVREIISDYVEEYFNDESDTVDIRTKENTIILKLPYEYNNFS